MAKYTVHGRLSASVFLGVYEAKSKEDAIDMADLDEKANWNPCLCHHCARTIEIGEIYEAQAESANDES